MQVFYIILFAICLFPWRLSANEVLPKSCHSVPLKETLLSLSADKRHLIFFHNLTDHDVWLANLKSQAWTTHIAPGDWAGFYAPKKVGPFKCVETKLRGEQQVSCQDVLAVCATEVHVPKHNFKSMNQWVANFPAWEEAKGFLERKGWQFEKARG